MANVAKSIELVGFVSVLGYLVYNLAVAKSEAARALEYGVKKAKRNRTCLSLLSKSLLPD